MAKKKKKSDDGKPAPRKPSTRQLDKIDREILALLSQRAELTSARGEDDPVANRVADDASLKKIVEQNGGPLTNTAVRAVFRELLGGARAIGAKLRVAYLGPEFTYSHLAAIEYFGQASDLVPVGTIASAFEEVEQAQADYGIVPIENSTDGGIVDTLECLVRSPVQICGEVPLHIHHCLLGVCARNEVRKVYSKPQALSQCRNWLSKHIPSAELCPVASTADAAKRAGKEKGAAAIASEQAGVNHSLSVLARNIEDNRDNVTRFAVIGAQRSPKTGKDKTSLVFEISHEPGALADAMGIFKRQKLNMTWIESFPMPGQRGRYLFFVEFLGHSDDLRARRALASLEKKTERLTILGSYAQAEPIG
ncbi:MAG: prephenate dehydratase [Planctomycetota bacterium]